MRSITKSENSAIIQENLNYIHKHHRQRISEILKLEQDYYCAYTEEYISGSYSTDIDHFNPNIKDVPQDNYYNWFLISTKINRKKNDKWSEPILHPTDESISTRISYENGLYRYDENDIEARNLDSLIGLNDEGLVKDRIDYIASINSLIEQFGSEFIVNWLTQYPMHVKFRTALNTVFGFNF